jgi:gluconate 5-dehydrogenase
MRDWLALNGRRALVVGAGGLGGASAVSLAAQGASVVLVDVDEANLESVAKAVKEAGGAVETVVADLSSAMTATCPAGNVTSS